MICSCEGRPAVRYRDGRMDRAKSEPPSLAEETTRLRRAAALREPVTVLPDVDSSKWKEDAGGPLLSRWEVRRGDHRRSVDMVTCADAAEV